jgi:hypothetical protein
MIDRKTLIGIGLILAVAGAGYFLVKKDVSPIAPPAKADESELELKRNAKMALNAYLDAVDAGESRQNLDKLNAILADEMKVRVAQNKQGKWVARSLDGKDILFVK